MARVEIRGRIGAPAAALWARIADFGDVSWVPGIRQLALRGSGPGMVRVVALGDAAPGEECLERIDPEGRWLEYSVRGFQRDGSSAQALAGTGPPAFPVRGYRGRMQVEDSAPGCALRWSAEFEPDGVGEEEAIAAIAQLGALLFRWLKLDLESSTRAA
jgi:polyketide cyclase/dehydrase/lipid transport protein